MMWDKAFYIAATTLVLSIIGILIDSNVGLDGNFSIIVALITTTIFNVYYNIKDKDSK